jgi:putative FmdB family regulatory protein
MAHSLHLENLIEILVNRKYILLNQKENVKMPIYEYRCKSCGYEFEELQSIKEKPITVCPKCSKPSVKRLLSSGPALVFKGSGFYATDYQKSNTSSSSGKKSKSSSKSESKPDSKQESKPGSKQESKPSPDTTSSADKK